jgi:two-component system OmpR family response regulator
MHLLIIEDEEPIARLLKEGLSGEGFAVDICRTGESGLAAAEMGDYDLVILDRRLPGELDGLEICSTLRHRSNHVPILMLTAKDRTQDRIDGLNSGADDYLIKPFSFEELLARIRALLRRPPQGIGELLTAGDVTLNPTTAEVYRSGKNIRLSNKEFAILEYLMRHKGAIVSKQALINHVWDFDADVLPSTVEVFIVYIRAKIDRPFTSPPIVRTVRGFGYKVVDPI